MVTPEIETLSKFVCPSTSTPPDMSKLDAVTAPTDILGVPDKFAAVPVVF